jgi:hypothetical protein
MPTSPRARGGVWERLHYDSSDPNRVVMTTTDSIVWGGASGHTYTFTRRPDGRTELDAVVVREGKNLKGRVLGKHIVGVEFKKKSVSKNLETLGTMTLYVDEKMIASGDFRTQSGHYALAGEGLAVGYDSGDRVSAEYDSKFAFTGGQVIKVIYDIADDVYIDRERELAAALARD